MDDAASRLTSDLAVFSDELAHTFGFIIKPAIDVTYLTIVMSLRLGLKSMITLFGFIVVASQSLERAKRLLPRSLKACALEKSELESGLRTAHDRLHTYREQIALQLGTRRERTSLQRLFGRVVRNEHEMLWSKAIIDTLNSYVLKYGGMMCGFSLLIEPIYRGLGQYAHATTQDITAGMMADVNLLTALSTAVSTAARLLLAPGLHSSKSASNDRADRWATLPTALSACPGSVAWPSVSTRWRSRCSHCRRARRPPTPARTRPAFRSPT